MISNIVVSLFGMVNTLVLAVYEHSLSMALGVLFVASFLLHAAGGARDYSEEQLVSTDFRRNPNSSIVDAEYTKVIGGRMLKVLSWYDNEWGYSCRVRDLIKYIAGKGL